MLKAFISYSHRDHNLKTKFKEHLKPLEEKFDLKVFDDKAILPGDEWEKRIWAEFEESQIVFVLVSVNFLNSEFCFKKEFKKALERHRRKQIIIVPIILKNCAWKSIKELANLQSLPEGGQPISGGKLTIDNAFANAIGGINKLLTILSHKSPKKSKRRPAKPMLDDYVSTSYRAVFFDLDGTLVRGKVGHESFRYSWQLVWAHLGFDDSRRRFHYQEYFDKKISYREWCDITRDLFREKGLSESGFMEMAKRARLTKNCKETLKILRARGLKTAIVSGGIDSFLEAVFPDYRDYFDYVFINKFHYDEAGVLASIETTPYDFEGKYDAITYVCKKHGFSVSECVFVGEGRNDVFAVRELSRNGGLTIGYPPEHLREFADHDFPKDRLDAILDVIFNKVPTSRKLPLAASGET